MREPGYEQFRDPVVEHERPGEDEESEEEADERVRRELLESIARMLESLPEDQLDEVLEMLGLPAEGGDRHRMGRDDPPPFEGRPRTGGSMDPMGTTLHGNLGMPGMREERRGAMDAALSVRVLPRDHDDVRDLKPRPEPSALFKRMFPNVARIRVL